MCHLFKLSELPASLKQHIVSMTHSYHLSLKEHLHGTCLNKLMYCQQLLRATGIQLLEQVRVFFYARKHSTISLKYYFTYPLQNIYIG